LMIETLKKSKKWFKSNLLYSIVLLMYKLS
jgi:hypothetical protein